MAFTPRCAERITVSMLRKRRRVGGDDMDVDAEPVGGQADRLLDTLRAVDGVERRMGVEHDLAVAVDGVAAGAQQFVDVRLLDLVAAKLDLDIGDVADDAAGAVAGPDVLDRQPDMRSASSTASRTANSLAAMSVM